MIHLNQDTGHEGRIDIDEYVRGVRGRMWGVLVAVMAVAAIAIISDSRIRTTSDIHPAPASDRPDKGHRN